MNKFAEALTQAEVYGAASKLLEVGIITPNNQVEFDAIVKVASDILNETDYSTPEEMFNAITAAEEHLKTAEDAEEAVDYIEGVEDGADAAEGDEDDAADKIEDAADSLADAEAALMEAAEVLKEADWESPEEVLEAAYQLVQEDPINGGTTLSKVASWYDDGTLEQYFMVKEAGKVGDLLRSAKNKAGEKISQAGQTMKNIGNSATAKLKAGGSAAKKWIGDKATKAVGTPVGKHVLKHKGKYGAGLGALGAAGIAAGIASSRRKNK